MKRHPSILFLAWIVSIFGAAQVMADIHYVDIASLTPQVPYTNWSTASTSIQFAVDAAASGDEILVAPGIYRLPGSSISVSGMRTLTLRSAVSRAAIIDGQGLSTCVTMNSTNSVLEGFTIRNGRRDGYGGGIDIATNCTIRDCAVVQNWASGAGGIMVYAPAVIENCTISSNFATAMGGGVVFYGGSHGLVKDCLISYNVASNYGGGVVFQLGGTVSNCVIYGNQAVGVGAQGGGVYLDSPPAPPWASIVNSVLFSNWAAGIGGGIVMGGSTGGEVINCTVVYNSAGVESGGVNADLGTLRNSIVYFNTAPLNANMFFRAPFATATNCCTTQSIGGSNFTNAPTFVDTASQDFHLATGSSCIDRGTSSNGVPSNDFEGSPRPRVGTPGGTAKYDVGAYEYGFHFNAIEFTNSTTMYIDWDIQDRGVYWLDLATNDYVVPQWEPFMVLTNGSIPGVYTQRLDLIAPDPPGAVFRLRVSHTPF